MKKTILIISMLLPLVTNAQISGADNETVTKLVDLAAAGGSLLAFVIAIFMTVAAGLKYQTKSKEDRTAEDTKELKADLSRIGIGAAIAIGAVNIVNWVWQYIQ